MVIPTPTQGPWAPFDRVGEVVVTVGRKFAPHAHQAQEVLTYVVEGFASYAPETGPVQSMRPGSVLLLTSPSRTSHSVNPSRGATVRWFAVVVDLPGSSAKNITIQTDTPIAAAPDPDGTVVRRLVGPGTKVTSSAGLSCEEVLFADEGTSFRRVGHDRRGVVYALAGRGQVDGEILEVGEAALVEDAAGLALHGRPGFRVLLVTAPRAG